MTGRRVSLILAALGLAALILAAAWWWVVFRQVIANGYMGWSQAVVCAGSKSAICDLAMALCGARHPFGIDTYSASLFWLALASLCGSLATSAYSRVN
ncbi:hypothetical protein [Taklimakanibacter deserti]|uniref:hypothetical protein n=1 Tax=Taklimakanibacter deserti TaxID=2267839 RepID=UPI000E65117D